MLVPKKRLIIETRDEQDYCVTKYSVYDTDDCAFVENKAFGNYETAEECQKDIDLFNSFSIVKFA
jgi:hypothetical protein